METILSVTFDQFDATIVKKVLTNLTDPKLLSVCVTKAVILPNISLFTIAIRAKLVANGENIRNDKLFLTPESKDYCILTILQMLTQKLENRECCYNGILID